MTLIWRSDRERRSPAMKPGNETAVLCGGDRNHPFLCVFLTEGRVFWYRTSQASWLANLGIMHVEGERTPIEELEHARGREGWERLVEHPELLLAVAGH